MDDQDVLEGLFKENKEILEFLSSGLASNENSQTQTKSREKLGEISEEKDDVESGKTIHPIQNSRQSVVRYYVQFVSILTNALAFFQANQSLLIHYLPVTLFPKERQF